MFIWRFRKKGLIEMIKPDMLHVGDKVAIVSLSSGMLGEEFCSHNIEIGVRRLKAFGLEPVFMPNALKGIDYLNRHPEKRAADLKEAFSDPSIKGVICAIGGDDTYRLLPYLMEDSEFIEAVRHSPKLFTGFSDTTINHFMFHRIGMQTFYGPCFICDLGEIANQMLPYTKSAFQGYFEDYTTWKIKPSDIWYEERTDFSGAAVGTERISHQEVHGYELLQGCDIFEGELLGGCLESIYDMLTAARYADEREICERYHLFPDKEEWRGKIMFLETCEEKPAADLLRKELKAVEETGAFDAINGIIVGKPQDEQYYSEYKEVYLEVLGGRTLPILYNVNFGHAAPRTALPYGAKARVNARRQMISITM